MSAETATVEVLTAHVRVLMVGARQVTVSVARQLDWVRRDRMTAFGRVHLPLRVEDEWGNRHTESTWLIGAAAATGALVLARPGSEADYALPLIVLAGLR